MSARKAFLNSFKVPMSFWGLRPLHPRQGPCPWTKAPGPHRALKRAPGPHAVKAHALCALELMLRVRNFNQKSKTGSFSHKTGNFQILAKSLSPAHNF